MRAAALSAFIVSALVSTSAARADEPPGPSPNEEGARTPTPLDALGPNVLHAFSGPNLLYYGGAIAATGVMAFGGVDQAARKWTQEDWRSTFYGDVSYYAGYVLPVVVAPGLYVVAILARDRTLAGAGAAATQALAVTLVTTGILKVATGRPFPTHGGDPNDPARLTHSEYPREFTPFALAGKYAWPSGHTSSTVSVAAALSAYYPESPWVPLATYPIALAIGVGMIDGDHHWASDVVAGALIGQAVGWSIGRDFRRLVREGGTRASAQKTGIATWQLRPLAGAAYGLSLTGSL